MRISYAEMSHTRTGGKNLWPATCFKLKINYCERNKFKSLKNFVKILLKFRKFPSKIYVFLSYVPVSATRCPFNPDGQAR